MPEVVYVVVTEKKRYGFWHFMGDLFLGHITGGLWFLYLLLRHLYRSHNR